MDVFIEINKKYRDFTEEELLDDIKICLCFELYFKATLLTEGYLIHKISSAKFSHLKDLKEKQGKSPVKIHDFLEKQDFYYDESKKQHTLSLTEKTLEFSKLQNGSYQKVICLPIEIHSIIESINSRRNSLHCVDSIVAVFSENRLNELKSLCSFVNDTIIEKHNILVGKLGRQNKSAIEKLVL
jgi:hypothetical protein